MSIDTEYAVLRKALEEAHPGWAVEFGVYSGYSLTLIAETMPVIGFDSFEGLPEDWREGFPKGAFNDAEVLGSLPEVPFSLMLIPGLFEDSVPGFPFPPLSLVHVDCDLYSSTVTALEGVIDVIRPGTILVFDEFHGYDGWERHEAKAWDEFCSKYEITPEVIAVGEQEKAFRVLSIGGSE